jgi:hypothetical protein
MTTGREQLNQYLDFALVQLAAESYLHGLDVADGTEVARRLKFGFNDPTHQFVQGKAGAFDSNAPKLPGYNRMVGSQATIFVDDYDIVDHHANDSTGFAATLFRRRDGDRGYVLSFRSTEYRRWDLAGDGERDYDGTSRAGIFERGFALGQLAAMEDYWRHIRLGDRWDGQAGVWVADAPEGAIGTFAAYMDSRESEGGGSTKRFNVTGYSLSGHLATVFTLMHSSEIDQTYTFNAAGHGTMMDRTQTGVELSGGTTGGAVSAMVAEFARALTTPGSITDDDLRDSILPGEADPAQKLFLLQAQRDAAASVVGRPQPFATEDGEATTANRYNIYKDPRYQFALAYVEGHYPTKTLARAEALNLLGVGGQIVLDAFFGNGDFSDTGRKIQQSNGSEIGTDPAYQNIVQLYGSATHDDYQITANSQRHTGNVVGVFIEDQPDVYGNGDYLGLRPEQSRADGLAGRDRGTFGTSHSLAQGHSDASSSIGSRNNRSDDGRLVEDEG